MAKYLFTASLTRKESPEPSPKAARPVVAVIKSAVEALGGTLESFYFVFGDDDVVVICELPDNETAAAFAMETSASAGSRRQRCAHHTRADGPRPRKKSGWRAPGT